MRRGSKLHSDADGVRIVRDSGIRREVWVVLAIVAVLGVGALLLRPQSPRAERRELAAAPAAHENAARSDNPGAPRALATAEPRAGIERRAAVAVPKRAAPATPAAPAAEAKPQADAGANVEDETPSGIALFPPPGTDPPKPGIIVPEGFELPPGYVRHFQATDDGQMLPPILMFHPDYEFVDEHGKPIEVPADRVVPPELAPPGLPIQILEVPDTQVPLIESPPDGEPAGDTEP